MAPGMTIAHSHLVLARYRARARAVTHFLGCSPSNPTVGRALITFYKGAEGKDAGRAMAGEGAGRVVADAGHRGDVGSRCGPSRWQVSNRRCCSCRDAKDGKQNTFRCHKLTVGLEEGEQAKSHP